MFNAPPSPPALGQQVQPGHALFDALRPPRPTFREGRLLSFATITDAASADVLAAGHDRGVVPIRAEHLDAWLNPDPDNLAAQYRLLDDREDICYVCEDATRDA